MEDSETRAKAISSGKELVRLLELGPRGNFLARWMAHYLAEQLVKAESSDGEEKRAARGRSFFSS